MPVAKAVPPDATCAAIPGDLWAPHVFFDGPFFNGFVAFEAPRPLTTTDHQLLPAAAVLDLAGEGLWSLGALAAAAGRPAHRHRHITTLRALLATGPASGEPHNALPS